MRTKEGTQMPPVRGRGLADPHADRDIGGTRHGEVHGYMINTEGGTGYMMVSIEGIRIKDGRRMPDPAHVRELASSIRELGLINPVTIDKENNLVAGLHRLEAARLLGWTEVECTVSSQDGLQAEMAEIDENIVRSGLPPIEYGEMLLRRKEIYETLHPETKATYDGGPFRGNQHRQVVDDKMSATAKSFVQDTADKIGVAARTVERQIRAARNLTPEAKGIIREANARLSKKTAMELSRLEPERQKEAAALLASGGIRDVGEYKEKAERGEKPGTAAGQAGTAAGPEVRTGEMEETGSGTAEETGSGTAGETGERTAPEPPAPSVQAPGIPGMVPGGCGASLKEIIAELKDPDKDCSGTPGSFLMEYAAFVRKFHKEIGWYSDPYYDTVYPLLTEAQFAELKALTGSICQAAEALLGRAGQMRKG